MGEVKFEGII